MKSEEELIEDVLCGKRESFEPLLRPYRQGMLSVAYRMTGDREAAREVCQEAIIKVFRYLGSFRKGKSFKSWLFRVVVNATHDFLRQEIKQRQISKLYKEQQIEKEIDPEQRVSDRETGEKIRGLLKVLSIREREVFLLRDGEGLSIKETAAALSCSSSSVRAHLSRARAKLRIHFGKNSLDKMGR